MRPLIKPKTKSMEKSNEIKNLAKALLSFQGKMQVIKKDSSNPFFKSKYASLNTILENIQAPLTEAGLAFSQLPSGTNGLTTILIHAESGEYLMETYNMNPSKNDPQGQGSAITYQRRYAIGSILGLNIDEDDDANEASKPQEKKEASTEKKYPDDDRPWLTEKQLAKIIERMKLGEDLYDDTVKTFKMKKEYKQQLENLTA